MVTYKFTIIEVPRLTTERDLWGEYSGSMTEIRISGEVCRRIKESTLIHEIIEAVNAIYTLGIKHDKIKLIEPIIYQIIKDNRHIFKKFWESEEKQKE